MLIWAIRSARHSLAHRLREGRHRRGGDVVDVIGGGDDFTSCIHYRVIISIRRDMTLTLTLELSLLEAH